MYSEPSHSKSRVFVAEQTNSIRDEGRLASSTSRSTIFETAVDKLKILYFSILIFFSICTRHFYASRLCENRSTGKVTSNALAMCTAIISQVDCIESMIIIIGCEMARGNRFQDGIETS